MRDDRFGFTSRFNGTAVEQDDGAHQTPADWGCELVAREQSGAVLETHPALGTCERTQPMAVDQDFRARSQGEEPSKRQEGQQQKNGSRDGIEDHGGKHRTQ